MPWKETEPQLHELGDKTECFIKDAALPHIVLSVLDWQISYFQNDELVGSGVLDGAT
jgi:hypothetical protein